jgi:hypothetical protein
MEGTMAARKRTAKKAARKTARPKAARAKASPKQVAAPAKPASPAKRLVAAAPETPAARSGQREEHYSDLRRVALQHALKRLL